MEIYPHELRSILADAVSIGYNKALINVGKLKPFLKKSEAYRIYGRATVDRWITEGLVTPVKDGAATSTVRLDRIKLETLAATSNRETYLATEERK